ncbi:hypothetical protein D1007_02595 [Hordeum vulgare]|nr:hypothetical protein D1007_02595 [Hordeum vulgare]
MKVTNPEEEHPLPMDVADPEEGEMKQSEDKVASAMGFSMEDAMAEFAVGRATDITEQRATMESIQDGAYVEAKRRFIRKILTEIQRISHQVRRRSGGRGGAARVATAVHLSRPRRKDNGA